MTSSLQVKTLAFVWMEEKTKHTFLCPPFALWCLVGSDWRELPPMNFHISLETPANRNCAVIFPVIEMQLVKSTCFPGHACMYWSCDLEALTLGSTLLSLKAHKVPFHRILKTLDLETQRLMKLSTCIQTNVTKCFVFEASGKPQCCQLWTPAAKETVSRQRPVVWFFFSTLSIVDVLETHFYVSSRAGNTRYPGIDLGCLREGNFR